VFLGDGSSKALQKTFYKQIVSKKSTKKPKTDFFSVLFLSRFWTFLGEGSSKTRLKNLKKNLTSPGTFLAPEEPTNHVGARHRHFFFECPSPRPFQPVNADLFLPHPRGSPFFFGGPLR
jgi:hypothetical protein